MCVPNFIKIGGGREYHWLISYGMTHAQKLFVIIVVSGLQRHRFVCR